MGSVATSSMNGRSGRRKQTTDAPRSNNNSDEMKGKPQLPVRSTIRPNTTGETIPAIPKPKFIIPLAEAAYLGAISIGTTQIGATINSPKRNANDRHSRAIPESRANTRGNMEAKHPNKPISIKLRRATSNEPVRFSSQSLSTPPAVSPTTPAISTPVVKRADFLRSKPKF